MNAAMELLSAALDTSGHIVVVGLRKGKPPIQNFFAPADYAGAVTNAFALDQNGYDAYYGTATFKDDSSRKADNALAIKTFKVDFDIDPDDDKKYPSVSAVFGALKEFCKQYNVARPVIVESGYGLHAYWILSDAMTADQGKLYAEKFKRIMLIVGMKIDPTVTGDVARILRVPGTHNYKNPDEPRDVKLLNEGMVDTHYTVTFLTNIDRVYEEVGNRDEIGETPASTLIAGQQIPAHLQGVVLDDVTKKLISGRPKKFSIVVRKSKMGEGCAQIKDIVENQAAQDEPRWRAGLATAFACEDGPIAIHEMSKEHPNYSRDETEKKAALTKGPYTCSTFVNNWPDKCKDCKIRGTITSPIQLGEYIKKASAGSNVVLAMNKNVDDAPIAYTIPEYPWPYFRADNGGVFRTKEGDDEGGEEVCDRDLYLVERLRDVEKGYILHLRVHHPTDGVLDFTVHTCDYSSPDKLREVLNKYGILTSGKRVEQMRQYINSWYHKLELQKEVATVKNQFGWTKNNQSFVIGEREFLPNFTEKYSPVAPGLVAVAEMFKREGSLETWKKIFNLYDAPGHEPHAFMAMVAFGGPLMGMTPYKGSVVNGYSKNSGSGKSAAMFMGLSVWGNPQTLMMNYSDTLNSIFHRMGVYQSMPCCVDEVTKMSVENYGHLLMKSTQGRGNARMKSSSNEERINTTTWNSPTCTSSNRSFVDYLQVNSDSVDGELMRLFEIPFPTKPLMSKEEADEKFNPMFEHYGHAGPIFIKALMSDLEGAKTRMVELQKRLDRDANVTIPERFWSVLCACTLTGGQIAYEAGLHNIDMEKMYQYAVRLIREMRARVNYTTSKESRVSLLGEFCNAHISSTITVKQDATGKHCTVLKGPTKDPLVARVDLTEQRVYVSQTALREFMRDRNSSLQDFLRESKANGKLVFEGPKRIASGMDGANNPVRVYGFQLDSEDEPAE